MDHRIKNLEIVNELKIHAPTLHRLKEQHSDLTDDSPSEDYFNNLQDIVLSQYMIESLTVSDKPIPSDYFDTLADNVLTKLNSNKKNTISSSFKKYAAVWVLFVLSILAIGYFLPFRKDTIRDDYSVNLHDLDDDELLMAVDNYIDNKADLDVMIEQGILDDLTYDKNTEEYQFIDYMDIQENEILQSN